MRNTFRHRKLTRDHTLAQQLIDAGVDPESEQLHRVGNVLTNCLGTRQKDVYVETHHLTLEDGDYLFICTDGLTDMVADDEIARTLSREATPEGACQAPVDLALDHGGKDDVTVVVARYRISC